MDGLKRSVGDILAECWPAIPIGLLALRARPSQKNLAVLLVPAVLFAGIWIALSSENNHLMRFQFPMVPMVLISLPSLTWGLPTQPGLPQFNTLPRGLRVTLAAAVLSCLLCCMFIWGQIYGPAVDIASGLHIQPKRRKFAGKGYTMAVTEAGQFPFFSKWRAIDALGLNDVHIAHYGIPRPTSTRTSRNCCCTTCPTGGRIKTSTPRCAKPASRSGRSKRTGPPG